MNLERHASMQQLHAVARWRQMQLEQAQAHYAELAARAEQQRAVVEYCRQQCQATHELLREQLRSAQPLSAVALLRLTEFASVQAEEERRQQTVLDSAQAAADTARLQVKDRFEQLSVVRKLAGRRLAQLREAHQQRQQRTLDEQAAGRRAPAGDTTQL